MLVKDRAGELTEAQRNLVEQAEKSCARMSTLLAELSDVANLEAGTATFNRSSLALFPLLDEVAENLRGTGEQPLGIDVRGESVPVAVNGDPVRLRAAFTGIGRAVSREQLTDPVLVIDRYVVQDDGGAAAIILLGERHGVETMHGADLRQLGAFDELRGGSGLALPAARRVIEAHGGRIWAPKGPQERAAAAVRLPVQVADAGSPP
jgi:signal transduction histidine kinase